MRTFQDLQEGVYDPNILKAFFLAGGPGSGKSYVVKRGTGGLGLKIVNSDDVLEKYIKDAGLSLKMPKSEEEPRDKLRAKAILGYDVHMIFVNTSLETALKRNAKRDRTVPRSIATKSWKTVQSNMGKFSQYFRQNFLVVDNNDSEEDVMGPVFKQVMSLAKKKVQNKTGLNWIQGELDKRKR